MLSAQQPRTYGGNAAAGHDEDDVLAVSFDVRVPGHAHNAADLPFAQMREIRAVLRALVSDDDDDDLYGQCTECDEYGIVGNLCTTCEDTGMTYEPIHVDETNTGTHFPPFMGISVRGSTVLDGNARIIMAALCAEAITNRGRVD